MWVFGYLGSVGGRRIVVGVGVVVVVGNVRGEVLLYLLWKSFGIEEKVGF